MKIFDAHTHLNDEPFRMKEEQYLEQAAALDVVKIATVGSNAELNQRAVDLSVKFPQVYAIVGYHPDDAKDYHDQAEQELRQQLLLPKTVAVGEIGLDYHWDASPREVQRKVFQRQLELARELKLPVNIHTRDALSDTYEILKNSAVAENGGIIHSFSGDAAWAQKFLDLGMLISFSGVVSFKNAKDVHEAAKIVPLDKLLVETDAPYLTPTPFRGKQNEPGYTRYVVEAIAQLKDVPVETVAAATYQNTMEIYGIDR